MKRLLNSTTSALWHRSEALTKGNLMKRVSTEVADKPGGDASRDRPPRLWNRLRSTAIVTCLAFAATTFTYASATEAAALEPSLPSDTAALADSGGGDLEEDEILRQKAVDHVVKAFESYGKTNGTYLVEGAGRWGGTGGDGWVFYETGPSRYPSPYPTSIASVLIDEGHFTDGVFYDPLWRSKTWTFGDMQAYRCEDRVGVFTVHGDGKAAAEDRAWWVDNNCTQYPADKLDLGYFKLSYPIPRLPDPPLPRDPEDLRIMAVWEMLEALESYGDANGTYLVDGSGFRGRGSGWAFYEKAGSNYPASIANALIETGHLPADARHDPLWENPLSIAGDVLVYRCQDRVAVFTREGISKPSTEDSDWWADNGCTRYPIDRLNTTYFKLSSPVDEAQTNDAG